MFKYQRYINYTRYFLEVIFSKVESAPEDCDLIIVSHSKDLAKLPILIQNWLVNINENIQRIILITNDTNNIPSQIQSSVDLIIGDNDIEYVSEFRKILGAHPRKAWYTQQIIKISAISISNKYIVIDSDTYLLKSHKFFHNGTPIVRVSHEDPTVYSGFENFIGLPQDKRSYIPHMGSFTSETLHSYFKFIEAKSTEKKWYEIIANFITHGEGQYSEWNSFNKFLLLKFDAKTAHWFNKSESSDLLENGVDGKKYLFRTSVSFHEPHE